ncbi:LysR substrate-binding domain-containing protein [Mangrovicoccus ximenensis]|uniref:LysR substrate-binding domain-containing protein n=1 Tax=Mangrovicoccus ximenensis TaxID=1911570 RepID=UPI001374A94A|nr:LysR substrate-binding domain-containing protein [Mangrovicoccus ximenensis]
MHPTAEAQRLFLETEKLLTGVARVENIARSIRELERGEVAVTAYPALSLRFLPKVAAGFLASRPDVRLSMETRSSRAIYESMLTGTADFGISLVPTSHPGLDSKLFHESHMICALPPGHPLAERPVIDLRDLAGEPFISLGRDDLSDVVTAEVFGRAGLDVDPVIRVQMADTACSFVAGGRGVALVPSLVTAGWRAEEVTFRPTWPTAKKEMWLYTRTYEPLSMLAGKLLERIRSELDLLEERYRPDPEAVAALPPLPAF